MTGVTIASGEAQRAHGGAGEESVVSCGLFCGIDIPLVWRFGADAASNARIELREGMD